MSAVPCVVELQALERLVECLGTEAMTCYGDSATNFQDSLVYTILSSSG